jgi:hypothetical protein
MKLNFLQGFWVWMWMWKQRFAIVFVVLTLTPTASAQTFQKGEAIEDTIGFWHLENMVLWF